MTANYANLTDQQLRQTISDLSQAARFGDQYASPTPVAAGAQSKYSRNVQAWSNSSTPPPKPPQAQAPSRSSRRTATRQSTAQTYATQPSTTPTTYQQHAPAATQPAAAPPPLPQNTYPPPPPIPTVHQGYQTTYSSRLRTGCTLLMQPIMNASTTATTPGRALSRRSTVVNYADPGSGDDMPEDGALDSEDSEFVAAGSTRAAIRQTRSKMGSGMSVFNTAGGASSSKAASTPPPGGASSAQTSDVLDQSYLGMIPPDRFIKPRYMQQPTMHEYPSSQVVEKEAWKTPSLVPIRVEFETDTHRIRDCFVWNLRETVIKPESFARTFCMDLDLSLTYLETISNQIKAQLEEYEGIASMDLGLDGVTDTGMEDETQAEEIPECRVIVSIDVQIATYHLMDHIEWDLLSPLTPEEFARQLCSELGLAGEAIPLIAHAIHEELMKHKKDAVEWGVIGGDKEPVPSTVLAAGAEEGRVSGGGIFVKDKTGLGHSWGRTPRDGRGPKTLRSVWRDWADAEEYNTRFEVLTAEEVERREIEKERASRRLRRETSKFQSSRNTRRIRY